MPAASLLLGLALLSTQEPQTAAPAASAAGEETPAQPPGDYRRPANAMFGSTEAGAATAPPPVREYRRPPAAVFNDGDAAPPAPGASAAAPTAFQLPGEYRRPADAMFGSGDAGYEAMVRGGAMAAQGRQGPLDGGWVLADDSGTELYAFQLTDQGEGFVDGAWRDLSRTGVPSGSGFFAGVRREGARLLLSFAQQGASAFNQVVLDPAGAGWSGELRVGAETRRVVMRRR